LKQRVCHSPPKNQAEDLATLGCSGSAFISPNVVADDVGMCSPATATTGSSSVNATVAMLAIVYQYGIWNALISAALPASPFSVRVWGRNLRNARYMAQAVDPGFLVNEIPGDPRSYGVSVTYAFSAIATK
jgi:hypothetical protein